MTLSRTNKQASLPCPAWVWASGSNIHTAKDRSWFGDDYMPFESYVRSADGSELKVIGIGNVTLLTKVSPNKTGPRSHSTLRLTDVLHVPSAICNIIGVPILEGYNITTRGVEGNITDLSDGRSVAYFKRQMEGARNFEIRLSGPPIGPKVGPSPFNPSNIYWIHASWPDSERERFAAAQASRQPAAGASLDLAPSEKTWLKKHFQSEFRFLQIYGLSVFREEDREEGRTILRTIMAHSEDGASESKKSDGFDFETR
ncbi:hypothetical protein FSARC_2681 [Fusarium sarcochroum]|uniref:Retrovirus-related Pol polyprotein from transposon TNT 1-94-like beta-barrel domain-containing protein n=1 Tax=Fusarium sarcochroum TaxID=1208366 RepID=A0A8H4U610_9HYPO|nr:hypothetical protein FSARC_2681 [Fusarium sarcochroum]